MASILENLIEILDKENTEYKTLIELADKKTSTIVKGDLESLGKITEDEQEIVGRIQGMEKQRAKVLADIANVVNRDVETLKLSNLIQMLEKMPDQQKMLIRIHEELKETMDQLRLTNNKNQLLLTERLVKSPRTIKNSYLFMFLLTKPVFHGNLYFRIFYRTASHTIN